LIRSAHSADFEQIWSFFSQIVSAGETYAYDPSMSYEQAQVTWMQLPQQTWVFEDQGRVLGSYYLKNNQAGFGDHVCNCGYMVDPEARGQGIASALCEHSLKQARSLGFEAMQFNFVVSSNTAAVRLWQKFGFEVVGRLPKAFRHPQQGYVDALVMYRWLE